ncbi:MAG TPA: hypothetical protein HA230_00950 [Candidatus Aenigmarchaeota archaeon]|nr:hypothetical protein [Candidatus Aenigmarchaeota archaeon]
MSYEFSRKEIIAASRQTGFLFNNRYGTVYPKQGNPPLVGIVDQNGNFLYADKENPV